MSLNYRSLNKLLRDHISGQDPLEVDPGQTEELTQALLTRIEPLPGVERNARCHHPHRHTPMGAAEAPPQDILCCCVLLEDTADRWYNNHTHLHLLLDPERHLRVTLDQQRSEPLSDLEEVVQLVQTFRRRIEQQQARRVKRQKQRDLKLQAILAQVRKIAKEDRFDFATEVDSVKLKLIVRLSEEDYFVILIPFKQFKEVLPKLRTAIQALRETYDSGVRFKTQLSRHYRRSQWTRHQDL